MKSVSKFLKKTQFAKYQLNLCIIILRYILMYGNGQMSVSVRR